ncbi:MAG: exopolysaccharide Pel transporter PelG [Lachnospiraceae bacterium]|nr:exopolysaccharide Pel transporter PelG [Lachnospiraceae bacterium]
MAGLGVRLNRIYEKHTLVTTLGGMSYSVVVTIAPMILVIGTVFALEQLLGFNKLPYNERELFSCTMLYIFIFALLFTTPLNAVISRYLADMIYEERYDEILPCFYGALAFTVVVAIIPCIPFFLHEYLVGGVDVIYILISFVGYMALIFVFYVMLYLSATKDYAKMSLFFLLGMILTFITSVVLTVVFKVASTTSILVGLDAGFLLIAGFEMAQVRHYFTTSSHSYLRLLPYFKEYWWLIVSNTFYMLGLYVHNFVFWTTDMKIVVRETYVCAEPYDMATFLALATNITATVIFITSVERKFHEKYKAYSEAIIGGRLSDIEVAKRRLFDQLSSQLLELIRLQFIISVVLFLLFVIFMPGMGMSGLTMQIYPLMAAAYFIMFVMYSCMIFLYYFNDLVGAMLTGVIFFAATFAASVFAKELHPIWYGLGIFIGALAGWMVAYFRLRWVERHMDRHIFCEGHLVKRGKGKRPSSMVYSADAPKDADDIIEDMPGAADKKSIKIKKRGKKSPKDAKEEKT